MGLIILFIGFEKSIISDDSNPRHSKVDQTLTSFHIFKVNIVPTKTTNTDYPKFFYVNGIRGHRLNSSSSLKCKLPSLRVMSLYVLSVYIFVDWFSANELARNLSQLL